MRSDALVTDTRATDGRALGRRGALTRQRLLDATAALLEDRGLRDLRVVDIARAVGTSPGTFYQYFRDVEESVLVLAHEVGENLAPVGELLARDWSGPERLALSRALVEAFVGYWDSYRPVLRTRNLAAQEGDPRFRAIRNESLRPLFEGLAGKVAEAQRDDRVDRAMTPLATASALVAMMERMAEYHSDLEPLGVPRSDLVETTARIIDAVVGGDRREAGSPL
jgi:AcrR family transcriptional regulator